MYTEQSLVQIAKRENNTKRSYLIVNRFQGKHIPVKPCEALAMFDALADKLRSSYTDETLLVIGFAETATAVGAAVAAALGADYMQTTREQIPDVEYLYFSEEHSHATEQKLVKNDIDSAVKTIDRILFVEDEVTTGKTIRNIIDILRKQYPEKVKFSVASVLNGMDRQALDTYKEYKIELFWLVKTSHAAYAEIAEAYRGDGRYFVCKNNSTKGADAPEQYIKTKQYIDARRMVHTAEYLRFCGSLYQDIVDQTDFDSVQKILVLGTEEFMYPALYVANKLESQGKDVWFHATTRSPITVSTEKDYPLHTRYELQSLYDCRRITYIYDLQKYDTVVIITDAQDRIAEGVCTLVDALRLCGNQRIICVCAGGDIE